MEIGDHDIPVWTFGDVTKLLCCRYTEKTDLHKG